MLDTAIRAQVELAASRELPVSYAPTLGVLAGHELCTGKAFVRDIAVSGAKTQQTLSRGRHLRRP
jgi:hypothetical protein